METKLLNKITKVRRILRWLIFALLSVAFSLSLVQASLSVIIKNSRLGSEELYVIVTLVPLAIATAALVIVVIILLLNSHRNKKILKHLDCIDDRGTPDGGL